MSDAVFLANGSPLFQDIALTAIKVLATLGGAVMGGVITGLLTQVICKACAHRPVPPSALFAFRGMGAIALGILVWVVLDWGMGGTGGFTFGGRGGGGGGPDTGPGYPVSITGPTGPTARTNTARVADKDTLLVEMLGGERYANDERFYLVDGKRPALTLAETLAALKQRRTKDPNVQSVEIVIYDKGSVAASHSAVVDLRKEAEDLGLTVKITTPGGLPPAEER